MVSNKTKARVGLGATLMMVRHPTLRRATKRVGAPTAKYLAKRQLREQAELIGAAADTAAAIVVIYGPIAAEALGLVEPPKPKHRARTLVVAAVVSLFVISYVLTRRSA